MSTTPKGTSGFTLQPFVPTHILPKPIVFILDKTAMSQTHYLPMLLISSRLICHEGALPTITNKEMACSLHLSLTRHIAPQSPVIMSHYNHYTICLLHVPSPNNSPIVRHSTEGYRAHAEIQHDHCYAKFSAHAQVQPSTHRRNDLIICFCRSVHLQEAPRQYPVLKLHNNGLLDLHILYSTNRIDFESLKFSCPILEDHPEITPKA